MGKCNSKSRFLLKSSELEAGSEMKTCPLPREGTFSSHFTAVKQHLSLLQLSPSVCIITSCSGVSHRGYRASRLLPSWGRFTLYSVTL